MIVDSVGVSTDEHVVDFDSSQNYFARIWSTSDARAALLRMLADDQRSAEVHEDSAVALAILCNENEAFRQVVAHPKGSTLDSEAVTETCKVLTCSLLRSGASHRTRLALCELVTHVAQSAAGEVGCPSLREFNVLEGFAPPPATTLMNNGRSS